MKRIATLALIALFGAVACGTGAGQSPRPSPSARKTIGAAVSVWLALAACGASSSQPNSSGSQPLHLTHAIVAYTTVDVNYLQEEGTTFKATIFEPNGSGPFPALLVVHGGVWTYASMTRTADEPIDEFLASHGMVVVAIDFRQDPQHHFPASIADVNYAMRWLRANAHTFKASSRMIGALGSSSGGHLVMLDAMTPSDPQFDSIPLAGQPSSAASPDYLVLQSPILDPVAREAFAQQTGTLDLVQATNTYFMPPQTLEQADPQLMLDRHESLTLPPTLIIQGTADKNLDYREQERFVTSYRAAGGTIELDEFQGAPHIFIDAAPGPDADSALAMIQNFIEKQLTNQSAKSSIESASYTWLTASLTASPGDSVTHPETR